VFHLPFFLVTFPLFVDMQLPFTFIGQGVQYFSFPHSFWPESRNGPESTGIRQEWTRIHRNPAGMDQILQDSSSNGPGIDLEWTRNTTCYAIIRTLVFSGSAWHNQSLLFLETVGFQWIPARMDQEYNLLCCH
jgi:hypothetical protein